MRLLRDVARVVVETARFAVADRRISLFFVVVVGLVLVALTFAVQVVTPLAVYPFV